ncbi:hypothetical protein MAM1_0739d11174 [Mucor ambiguus]|uniref:Uncharacterized protein n=1 Tax=Mucor ambiguus TaxID=91626 RepID=A0A0C9LZ34_9FUNG|nr:hypothetical protein MAM1_0739d11174 [Mucor ambiguus]
MFVPQQTTRGPGTGRLQDCNFSGDSLMAYPSTRHQCVSNAQLSTERFGCETNHKPTPKGINHYITPIHTNNGSPTPQELASACIESIEYTTAATDMIVPVPEFIVRFHDAHVYFESIIKLSDDLHIRRTYAVVPIPTGAALLQTFLSKTVVMYQWRDAVVNLVNIANKKQARY